MTMGEVGCFLSHYGIWEDVSNDVLDELCLCLCKVGDETWLQTDLS